MTTEQKMYWYNVGREQASEGIEEPEHGRMNRDERCCWYAGYWSWMAGMPRLPQQHTDTSTESETQDLK